MFGAIGIYAKAKDTNHCKSFPKSIMCDVVIYGKENKQTHVQIYCAHSVKCFDLTH